MKIDKKTLKNKQAWITFKSKDGEYVGTMHLISDKYLDEFLEFVELHKGEVNK